MDTSAIPGASAPLDVRPPSTRRPAAGTATTLKVPPDTGAAVRLAAHLEGQTISRFAESAIIDALKTAGRRAYFLPRTSSRTGRPPVGADIVRASILAIRPTRKDAFTVTLDARTYKAMMKQAIMEGISLGDWAAFAMEAMVLSGKSGIARFFLGTAIQQDEARIWVKEGWE